MTLHADHHAVPSHATAHATTDGRPVHVQHAELHWVSVIALTGTLLLRVHLLAGVDALDGVLFAALATLVASRA